MKTLSFLTTAFSFFISTLLFTLLTASNASSKTHEHETHRSINKISALEIRPKTQSNTSAFDIEISVDGVTYTLVLQPNQKLSKKLSKKQNSALSILKGTIKDVPNSWVRLTLKDGLYSGAFFDGTELYFVDLESSVADIIVPSNNNQRVMSSRTKQVIYKAADVELNATCALEIPNPNTADTFDYSNFVSDLSSMAAAAAGRSINVKVLADTEYNAIHSGGAYEKMLSEMNVVDGIFSEQVNVELNITDAIVLTDNGSLTTTDATDLVYNLRTQVAQTVGNQGITHLFTGKELDGNTVGIAFVDALCSSYGVGLSQHFGSQTALVVAHEIGHNFGAPHDAQSGSLCSSTANSFLMNPYINGSNQFSACSLTNIELGITKANTWYSNACVVDISEPGPIAPLITSVAGLEATVGEAYAYDSDNIVEASGSTPLSYSFDYAPDGMTIDSDGLISWTPSISQAGINPVQLRVSNAAGEDIQIFDIDVSEPVSEDMINFNVNPPIIYGNDGEDFNIGAVTIEGGGATINLVGNRWRAINFPYVITLNTVIEFDFKSSSLGEIHGIGFDADLTLNEENNFNLFGSQIYGIQDFIYTDIGEVQHFVIPVGEYYTGAVNYLFFAMAHDVTSPTADSLFSKIQVYEKEVLFPVNITFNANLGPNIVAAEAPFSVTATLTSDEVSQIEKIEFSLDLITWSTATQINQSFTSEQLGPVEGGEHNLYVKVNSGAIQTVNFSAVYRYYFLNPDWIGQPVNLVGLEDNTSLTFNGEIQTINKGQSITYIVSSQGESVTANKPFAAGTDVDGLNMPVPSRFIGTQFVVPNIRYTHYYYLLSPSSDAQVQIQVGQSVYNITLTAGIVHTFNAGSASKIVGLIQSDIPILLSHSTNNNSDAYPVAPATKELWGIRSQWAYVAALENNTQVTIYADNGASQSFILNAGGIKEITIGLNTEQGQGSAIHIVADKPIAAIQHADSDGYQTTTFGNVNMLSTNYILPVESQYIAIVCNSDTFITLQDQDNNTLENTSCLSEGGKPSKAYFNSDILGIDMNAGYQIKATNPVYLIYEATATDDEHNLLGNNSEPDLIQLGFQGSDNALSLSTSDEFIATATPTPSNTKVISSVEFSLDGDNWISATLINEVYQASFGQLTAGKYTLYARINNLHMSTLTFTVLANITDNTYYFLNPDWIGQPVNLVGLEDNTSLTFNGEIQTINKGQSITYIVSSQGESVTANKPFAAGTDTDGLNMPAPSKFLGTQFAIPNIRYSHYYYLLSPTADTQVQVIRGQKIYDISLSAGVVHTFSAGSATKVGSLIQSDLPILISHSTNINTDVYPIPPAATELWGIRSKWAYVAATQDNTQINVYADNGGSQSFTLNGGDIKEITIGLNTEQGQGSALHIIADKPVAAIQHADGDGYQSTAFGNTEMLFTDYTLPVDTQYIAIVCTTDTFITLRDSNNNTLANTSCITDESTPGKAYFSESSEIPAIQAGYQITATQPIFVLYEAKASDDEHNLLGR